MFDSSEDESARPPAKRSMACEDVSAMPPAKRPMTCDDESAERQLCRGTSGSGSAWHCASFVGAPPVVAAGATAITAAHGPERDVLRPAVRDWRDPLREALHERFRTLGPQRREIILDTLCSGTDTESYATGRIGPGRA